MGRLNGWFKVNALGDRASEILMFGEVGWEINAAEIVAALSDLEADDLTVRMNSPGGDAYEGVAIMNALRGHPAQVTVVVEGLAASAASVIAVGGGDRLVMRPGSELMIHNAWAFTNGDSAELAKMAGDLDRVSATIAGIYAEKAGTDTEMWRAAMSAETWFSADEAVSAGLADAVEDAREGKKALVGTFNLSRFKHAGRSGAPAPLVSAADPATRKETAMAFHDAIARRLGVRDSVDEDVLLAALDQVLSEQVATVTVALEVTYPDEVEVTPTGKATVAPTGAVPDGLTFSVGNVPDGWSAEVNETTGELTVTAPDGGLVGDTAEIGLTVSGGEGEPTELVVTAVIVSASGDGEGAGGDNGDGAAAPTSSDETVTLDRGVYDSLMARAALGDSAAERESEQEAVALVDSAIRDGKVLAAKKADLVARTREDLPAMKAYFDRLASGTIPVSEKGRGGSDDNTPDPVGPSQNDLARGRASLGIRR